MTERPKHAAHILSLVPALAGLPSHLLEPETPEQLAAREARERAALWEAQHPTVDRMAILRDRGIPAKDIDRLLANDLRETPAIARVRRWLMSGDRVLVLAGAPDAGKTTAASFAASQDPSEADCRWWRDRVGVPAVAYLEAELLLKVWLNRTGREPLTGRSQDDLVSCWLLVIDDLGQEASTDAVVGMVGEAVDHLVKLRSDRRLRTLITTNIRWHSPPNGKKEDPANPSLVARYGARGQRILQRLTEFGAWYPCEPVGLRRVRGEGATT